MLPAGLSLATEGPALETWSLSLSISKILVCVPIQTISMPVSGSAHSA